MTPKSHNLFEYILEISAIPFWTMRPWMFLKLAQGRTTSYAFVPPSVRGKSLFPSVSNWRSMPRV